MTPFLAEFVGTGLLIILGQGVVCNVVLQKTKGHNSGWIVISWGWAMGVYVGVYCSATASKAHLNPAVTLAFATLGIKYPGGRCRPISPPSCSAPWRPDRRS